MRVIKRDGKTVQEYSSSKIERAVTAAFLEVGQQIKNEDLLAVNATLSEVLRDKEEPIPVELVEEQVEEALINLGHTSAARAYIEYRTQRDHARAARLKPDPNAIADYIHPGKYSRYVPELKRREVYEETVARVEDMHLRRFAGLGIDNDIKSAFSMVREKRVLPSMRSMQFAGPAIEACEVRQFNCSYLLVDKVRAFSDALYLLLAGCGVGYSVQFEHVEKLPPLKYVDETNVRHHTVQDTIEGWSSALKRLVDSYAKGYYVEFNYSKVRPAGSPLKTSGGKAPGHIGLKRAMVAVRKVLHKAQGRQLRPIECYDIMCHAADAVLSGGIRRSATIALFSLEDGEMMNAKVGNWFETHPWRANSNNSVMLKRDEVKKKHFKRVFKSTREFGEPGFVFTEDLDYGFNPCAEINLNPVLEVTEDVMPLIEAKRKKYPGMPKVKVGDRFTGVAFCNLTTQNAAKFEKPEDFYAAARAAAVIGTLQASYTDFPFLGWVSEVIAEREALLGVSITGIMDCPDVATDPEVQRKAAAIAVETNKEIASKIGVRPAARVTAVKPEGTSSLLLGCVGSGIHPHHARRYIRRVTANPLEPVFQFYREHNEHQCRRKQNGDFVIEFPVVAPDSAILKSDLPAIDFLEVVKSTQENWVVPGIARPESSPGACHNVSNTCVVRDDEWDDVAEYLWENKDVFSGVSLLPETGDKDFAFAPLEAVSTEADEDRFNQLVRYYQPVDYKNMIEENDETDLKGELACAGGACELT